MKPLPMRIPFVVLAVPALFLPSMATAGPTQVECTSLPNATIGAGGSASVPLLAAVGAALASIPDPPVTVVYQSTGACFGITPYVDGTALPLTGTATYWDAAGTALTCTLPVTGEALDFGMLGVKGTLCEGVDAIPAGIGTFEGPITGWNFIVPTASSQTSISAEAVYFIYGFGAAQGQVSPWTVEAELYSRNTTSAAGISISLGAGFPPASLKGVDVGSNGAMVSSLAMSQSPENAIGFVSAEVADGARDSVRTLAYQAPGQSCGYWPDSTVTSFDKKNVRDGHYDLWSPYQFYAPIDDTGAIIDEPTRRFVGYFTGSEALPTELPLLDIVIDNGTVPLCAMTVWRDEEIGPQYSRQPTESCGCYYDFRATGATDCSICATDDECTDPAAPVCRYGYCEAT